MAEQLRICAYVDELGKLMHTDTQRLKSDIALTPHAPAQSALDELRAENAALKEKLQEQALQALSDDGQWIEHSGKLAAERDELRREVEALRAIIRDADRMLTNLQPHIPQACLPGRSAFIDNYVDPALEKLRSVLPEWDAARAATSGSEGEGR